MTETPVQKYAPGEGPILSGIVNSGNHDMLVSVAAGGYSVAGSDEPAGPQDEAGRYGFGLVLVVDAIRGGHVLARTQHQLVLDARMAVYLAACLENMAEQHGYGAWFRGEVRAIMNAPEQTDTPDVPDAPQQRGDER